MNRKIFWMIIALLIILKKIISESLLVIMLVHELDNCKHYTLCYNLIVEIKFF